MTGEAGRPARRRRRHHENDRMRLADAAATAARRPAQGVTWRLPAASDSHYDDCGSARNSPRAAAKGENRMSGDVTEVLAGFAASLQYDDLPGRVKDHCKNVLLDTLA